MTKPTVTARDLRTYFNADPKRLDRLSPEARKTVEAVEGKFPKGRVSPEAIADHNRHRKVQYVSGASQAASASAREAAQARRAAAAEAGFTVGTRGPLPKAFLAQSKG